MKKILFFSFILFLFACKQSTETNNSTTTEVTTNYMTKNGYDLAVHHAFLEIYDTVGLADAQYFIDTIGRALQEKFLFVDARNEIRATFNADEVNIDRTHPNFPYLMQVHVKQAPKLGDYQLIQVTFTDWGMPFLRLGKSASIVTGGGVPNTSFFADCSEPTPGCTAKYNLKKIAEMCFTQVTAY